MSKATIFLIGATGYIGLPLSLLLLQNGFQIAFLSRDSSSSNSTQLQQKGGHPVQGTLDNTSSWIQNTLDSDILIDVSQNNADRPGHAKKVENVILEWNRLRKEAGKGSGSVVYTSGTGVCTLQLLEELICKHPHDSLVQTTSFLPFSLG